MALPGCVLPDRHPSEEVEKNSTARVEGDIPETPQLLCASVYILCGKIPLID